MWLTEFGLVLDINNMQIISFLNFHSQFFFWRAAIFFVLMANIIWISGSFFAIEQRRRTPDLLKGANFSIFSSYRKWGEMKEKCSLLLVSVWSPGVNEDFLIISFYDTVQTTIHRLWDTVTTIIINNGLNEWLDLFLLKWQKPVNNPN